MKKKKTKRNPRNAGRKKLPVGIARNVKSSMVWNQNLLDRIVRYAADNNLSRSAAVCNLCETALDAAGK